METTKSIWNLQCTNPSCGNAYSMESPEYDVICKRCGGFVSITEHITYKQTEDYQNNDVCSN